MSFKKFLLAGAALLTLGGALSAQVNLVPQVGVTTAYVRQNTYSASSVALVTAASATDVFCISGSATKNIRILGTHISGIATTAISVPIQVMKRASLDTGGTAATGVALPVAAPSDSSEPAPTAVLTAYTANPTINDSSPGIIRTQYESFPLTTSFLYPAPFYFGTYIDNFAQSVNILKNTTQQVCINFNGVTVSGPSISIDMEWTED